MDREQLRLVVLPFAALWFIIGWISTQSWPTWLGALILVLWVAYEVYDAIHDHKEGQRNEKYPKRPHKYHHTTYRR